jgi:hypothetical protein
MKKLATVLLIVISFQHAFSQVGKLDSLFNDRDTTAVMDSLMSDFEKFLDSLSAPKSFFALNLGVGTGFFSFENKNSVFLTTRKKLIFSPSAGYYHRSGLGISATAFLIHDDNAVNLYQVAFSPSYDFIRKKLSTGISYTRYFSKDSLNFYATPIQNELFAYFTWKGWWLRPSVNFAFGWGSKTEYERRRLRRYDLILSDPNRYFVDIKNEETVQDFSVTVSLRKDFDWYDVLGKNDNITFTPVLMLNSGTQNFGFNTSYSYRFNTIRANSLPSNSSITDKTGFAMQSASCALRGSYLKGRFLIQPQVLFDYYLPDLGEDQNPLNTVFSITAGWTF